MRLSFFILLFLAVALHAVPIRGVVLEETTDRPIPYVSITYISGKPLGQCDNRGRFELDLESRNAILVFKKNGFDSTIVEMQDYADLLDIAVNMRSDARHLGSATVIGGGSGDTWQNPKVVSVQQLEDAAGLRFDLTEHLSQMPGMSGQMDFSSNLFYDGSRAEEVAYHLGLLRIPNMRHLDIGFPGNLSVINPHAIKNINISEHYGVSPFSQGLAGAIQFEPRNSEDFKANISLGTTLREIYTEGPGFALGARYLDPSMLKNMGEKFFTEFKKQDDSCDDCVEYNSFTLSSMDLYARFFGSDSGHNIWAVTGLYASDKYSIQQNGAAIIQGSQVYGLASAEYRTLSGTNFHVGIVSQETSDTLRDTSSFRRMECPFININPENCYDNNFIYGYEKTHFTASTGLSWEQTDKLGFALLYDFHHLDTLKDNVGQANAYYKIGASTLGIGGIFSYNSEQIMPLASFDIDKEIKKDLALFGSMAWRSDWHEGELNDGVSLKAGTRLAIGWLKISTHGFGRYYPNPILPNPLAFKHYKEQQDVDLGWVSGAQATFNFRSSHRVAFQSNISSIYGEYELPNGHSLPWQANSRLDMVSHLRIYPRSDSLISFIVSHRAALDRPLYEWSINPAQEQRHIKYAGETVSLFRTDVRLNLDLKSKEKLFFLENVRFFVEADNIFSSLDVKALRFLGGDNGRERSVAVRDGNGNSMDGFDIVPFMAKGMGLYLQFGVEGNFGI